LFILKIDFLSYLHFLFLSLFLLKFIYIWFRFAIFFGIFLFFLSEVNDISIVGFPASTMFILLFFIFQPVSLLPTTLKEYEEALPDLSREKILAIFREVETAKEVKLSNCREFRRQIIWEEEYGNGDDQERAVNGVRQRFEVGRGTRKLSCLSPIVECVGGRDSALRTSQSETVSGLSTNQSGVNEARTSQLVTLSSHGTSQSGTRSLGSTNKSVTVIALNSYQFARVSDEERHR
jgi:hypothetical protein